MHAVQQIQKQRQQILEEVAELEQVRRGSLTEQMVETVGPDGRRHQRGPYPLYTFKEDGKTVSRRVTTQAQIDLYRQQIHQGRRFQELTTQLLRLGEALSDQAVQTAAEKKNLEAQVEKQLEASRIIDRLKADQAPDLEAWEQAVWQAALQAGAHVLETVLAHIGTGRREQPLRCGCGAVMESVGLREKALTTLLGTVPYSRSLFVCPNCAASCFPGDRQLDVEHTGFSPGVRRRMARAGSRGSFGEAEEDLWFYSRIRVCRRDIERIAEQVGQQIECWQVRHSPAPPPAVPTLYVSFDGTAAPMRRGELKGRKGKQADGSAKGREVKVGCVFTQTHLNEEGFPVRDEDSTTYVAGIESSTLFGNRMYHEAVGRGLEKARRVIALTDGAAYNKTIVQMHFPMAQHIIDLYHAREHLHLLGDLVLEPTVRPAQLDHWSDLLDQGRIASLLKEVQDRLPHAGKRRREALKQMRYFEKNAPFMRYAAFRSQGLFIGSGVIEAGCRTVVGQRLKQPGMFWSLRGAHAILQIRCCLLSRRFDDFWESRTAA